jgi:hypothetical protein
MAKYRVVGKPVGHSGTEFQDTPTGKVMMPVNDVWEVGQEVDDVPAHVLKSFPDRFERIDGEDDPLYPDGPPPEVTGSSIGGVAQSEPLSERMVPAAVPIPNQPSPQVSGRRSAGPDTSPTAGKERVLPQGATSVDDATTAKDTEDKTRSSSRSKS